MSTVVHCPACGAQLSIPPQTNAQRARCPKCREVFDLRPAEPEPQPPAGEESGVDLDDTVAGWLSPTEEEADEEVADETGEGVAEDDPDANEAFEEAAQFLTGEADAGPSPPPAPPSSASSASEPEGPPAPAPQEAKKKQSPRKEPQAPARASAEEAPTRPRTSEPPGDAPRLRGASVGTHGVQLSFDARLLDNDRFRPSMPFACHVCGEGDIRRLGARPVIWADQLREWSVPPGELASRHEVRAEPKETLTALAARVPRLEGFPKPLDKPLVAFVCQACGGHGTLTGETTPGADGTVCTVEIPNRTYALAWLGRVNGICGSDYAALEDEILKIEQGPWRLLSERVRDRVAAWFDFQAGERFMAYFNEADFAASGKDEGFAGLILTDQRLVYKKFHHHGDKALDEGTTLVLRDIGKAMEVHYQQGEQRSKLPVRVRHDDASHLTAVLDAMSKRVGTAFE